MQKITIHTDGGARQNPGPAGIGVVIQDESEKVIGEISKFIGSQTNNFAEYEALIQGLLKVQEMFAGKTDNIEVSVVMDSELVVKQCQGLYKIKEPTLKEQWGRVQAIRSEFFPHITFTHVRREFNKRADELVNAAVDASLGKA
ncbi:MAG TPA: ribonuclease HI family protein [Candidatus Paceibacterota bacterium]|nr:ribonuclease HI family protein [Candidatus Paceibacterota bacterium]